MAARKRLDLLVLARGLAPTRARAQAVIMAGLVAVDGAIIAKPGALVDPDSQVELRGEPSPFVSRGGHKLAKALTEFAIDLTGRIVLDVGASTGGFSDCCLQAGAKLVYAVDVGYGQLAWRLRTDPRVISLERTNIRGLKAEQLQAGTPDFCCIDVAFISLGLVLPLIPELGPRELVMLVKPQFEAGRRQVGKGGVVRDPAIHLQVLRQIIARGEQAGFVLWNLDYSPIRGPQGNIEYLAHGFFAKTRPDCPPDPQTVVARAHKHFLSAKL